MTPIIKPITQIELLKRNIEEKLFLGNIESLTSTLGPDNQSDIWIDFKHKNDADALNLILKAYGIIHEQVISKDKANQVKLTPENMKKFNEQLTNYHLSFIPTENTPYFFDDKYRKTLQDKIDALNREERSVSKRLKMNALALLRDSTPETIHVNYEHVLKNPKVTGGVFSHRTMDVLNEMRGKISELVEPGYYLNIGTRFKLNEMITQLKKESNSIFSIGKAIKIKKIKALELIRDSKNDLDFNQALLSAQDTKNKVTYGRHSRTRVLLDTLEKEKEKKNENKPEINPFKALPDDMLNVISSYLDTKSRFELPRVNKFFNESPSFKLSPFRQCVALGNQDKAKSLLEKNHQLFTERGMINDGVRTFKNVTGFEYALWVPDRHMWEMILNSVPKGEEGRKIVEDLLKQYNEFMANGLTYEYEGKTVINSKHYDIEPLINAHKEYDDNFDVWYKNYHNKLIDFWCQDIGGLQKLAPACVRQLYRNGFQPMPTFKEDKFERKSGINRDSKNNFALSGGKMHYLMNEDGGFVPLFRSRVGDKGVDFAALTAWYYMRTTVDLPNLKNRFVEMLKHNPDSAPKI
jgi:hypothetical protein